MRITIVSLIFCALSHLSAIAQTATQDILITATVATFCSINNAASGPVDSAVITVDGAGAVDTTPVTPDNSPYANVACNAPSDLQLTSLNGGLTTGASAVGFDDFINYQAQATWNSVTASVDTSSSSGTGAVVGTAQPVATAFNGSLSVLITPTANAQPLVQGAYSDTLRVTLTPQ